MYHYPKWYIVIEIHVLAECVVSRVYGKEERVFVGRSGALLLKPAVSVALKFNGNRYAVVTRRPVGAAPDQTLCLAVGDGRQAAFDTDRVGASLIVYVKGRHDRSFDRPARFVAGTYEVIGDVPGEPFTGGGGR